MVIDNETFYSYRQKDKEIKIAIRLLIDNNYKVIDLENQLIHSGNVDKRTYSRVAKQNRVYINK
ncbi:MAG: hypothetical protein GOVbin2950_8 [Prokaryotic dsDNA virus sp.]|nr:MAG: hypothetical protein GOVbin2950_8 [Prokaryotic dsDNA virus sp.]|tara:strand:- start:336 stop:527 length:192 start_codon:yes stop_codon:yes gene_type:complete